MSFNRLLTYTCLALIGLMIIGGLLSCECVDKNYKTGACTLYQRVNGDYEFVNTEWFTEPCGCDDLYEMFLLQTPLDTGFCVRCNHPYESCPSYSNCNP